jgi:hypothetical protein
MTSIERGAAEPDMLMLSEVVDHDFSEGDIMADTIGLIPTLVSNARFAALNLADSHRGFKVGASGLAYDTTAYTQRVGTYTNGNFKALIPEEFDPEHEVGDIPKNCAEMGVIIGAANHSMERFALIAIAGTTQRKRIEGVTGVRSATLQPCDECSRVMSEDSVVDDNTILLTVGSGADIFQVQSFGEYRKRREEYEQTGQFIDIPVYRYTSFLWGAVVSRYAGLVSERDIAGRDSARGTRKKILRQQAALEVIKGSGLVIAT